MNNYEQNSSRHSLQVEESEENSFLSIKLKKNVTRWNLFAIFYVFFLMTSIGGYINVQIVYLLRDPDLFAMEPEY